MNQYSDYVAAHFRTYDDAAEAVRQLHDAGFHSNQIGCSYDDEADVYASRNSGDISGSNNTRLDRSDLDSSRIENSSINRQHDRSFMDKVKDFFSGEEGYEDRDTGSRDGRVNDGPRVGPTLRIPDRYNDQLSSGGAFVTVHDSSRREEAERILQQCGGTIDRDFSRDATFEEQDTSVWNSSNTAVGNLDRDRDVTAIDTDRSFNRDNVSAIDRDNISDTDIDRDRAQSRRIRLLSEVLRVNKERVQTGEVRLRKEVRTENQTIEVPVSREELVIERIPTNERSATGENIGDNDEIRVPLSEERVHVEKAPVVREEVRVDKRNVQNTETVSEDVRHEDLQVDDSTGRVVDNKRGVDKEKKDRKRIA